MFELIVAALSGLGLGMMVFAGERDTQRNGSGLALACAMLTLWIRLAEFYWPTMTEEAFIAGALGSFLVGAIIGLLAWTAVDRHRTYSAIRHLVHIVKQPLRR